NGINGTNGANGINGTNGMNGTNGINGTDGINGTIEDLSDYALKNQSETFAGNITTLETGFFGWLGSLTSRITKLWVEDIDASGNVTASQFIGDGSLLTGISGGGTTFNQDLNTTNDVIFNSINTTNLISNGKVQGEYYSSDGSLGITETVNYRVCITPGTGGKCDAWCVLQIKNGLIVGCV
ncbi:MAG: hypothetical protein NUV46_00005, partial [Nanoarchaeota archaeon]|nr:hypothetical protein [Nanoarchaeota archaeon]